MTFLEIVSLVKDIAVIFGVSSVIYAVLNYRASIVNHRTQLFLMLRKYYMEVHDHLHKEIPFLDDHEEIDKQKGSLSSTQKAAIQQYWINSFNEWYTTNRLYSNDSSGLWNSYYRTAIGSSLTNPLLRDGLKKMFLSNYSFGQCEKDFRLEIKKMVEDILEDRLDVAVRASNRVELQDFRSDICGHSHQ